VATAAGQGLLGRGPVLQVVWTSAAACLGVAALAIATGGWVLGIGEAGRVPRILAGVAGLLLMYLNPISIALGAGLLTCALVVTYLFRRTQ
jgi:hypothetical protein